MRRSPFHGHRFPPEVLRSAVWLYLRFTLSFRDIDDILAERGLDVSYETIRRWVLKVRAALRRRPRPSSTWHLDEMAVRIGGKRLWLWRGGRPSISWCSDGATPRPPSGSCGSSSVSRASRRPSW